MDKITEILKLPTIIDNVHESVYRSYHVLGHVMTMIEHGDSKETIKDFYNLAFESSNEVVLSKEPSICLCHECKEEEPIFAMIGEDMYCEICIKNSYPNGTPEWVILV